jgi:plastocyanin
VASRMEVRTLVAGTALLLAALIATLAALAPSSASAAPSPGCTQTGGTAPVVEYTCYIAPITVAGYEVKQDIAYDVPKPPVDGAITHFETDVVDENAVPIPINRLMLHHIVFANLDRGDLTCRGIGFSTFDGYPVWGGYAPERFAGAGEERAKLSLPSGYGYELNGTGDPDRWALVYMLMNHKPHPDTAYVQYKLTVDTSGTLQPVRPYWFDINNCKADPIYNVPGLSKKQARKAGPHPVDRRHRGFIMQEDGYIVAGGGHVHGGARKLTITKPSCDNLQIASSTPTWGLPSHPFYNVRPVLHEPGPIGMSAFNTETGIPVRKGQTIRLNSIYDDSQPHTRVMGIYVVYVAADPPGGSTPATCGGAPADIRYGPGTNLEGRTKPVPFKIPLTGLDANGNAIEIKGPAGKFKRLRSGATIDVGDRFYSRPNIRIKQGATLDWNFLGSELHNVTLANGPRGIGSPNLNRNRDFIQRFNRPGVYRFFCALHPVQMHERVIVKKRKRHRR